MGDIEWLNDVINTLQLDMAEARQLVKELREAVQLGKGVVECDNLLKRTEDFLEVMK